MSGKHIAFFDPHCQVRAPAQSAATGFSSLSQPRPVILPSRQPSSSPVSYFVPPRAQYLPNINAANPGKRIDFVAHQVARLHPDQFEPFRVFGCDMQSEFPGTLFRFALRSEEQAASSRISKQAYTPDRMRSTLREFGAEVVESLLFLKSVELIEVSEWADGHAEPSVLFTAQADLAAADAAEARVSRAAFNGACACFERDPEYQWGSVHRLAFRSRFAADGDGGSGGGGGGGSGGPEERRREFLVSQAMGGPAAAAVSRLGASQYGMRLVPWTAVAAEVGPGAAPVPLVGQAFCFLPLPVKTGLPVHVNGFFELSSNRRDIWFGDDMAGGGALRSEWNCALLSDVAAPAYARLLEALARTAPPPDSPQLGAALRGFYALWPPAEPPLQEPWAKLGAALFAACNDKAVLFSRSAAPPPRRKSSRDRAGMHAAAAAASDENPSAAAGSRGQWVSVAESVLPDVHVSADTDLADGLERCGMALALPPPQVAGQLLRLCPQPPAVVAPAAARGAVAAAAKRSGGQVAGVPRAAVLALLRYVLSDVDPGNPVRGSQPEPVTPLFHSSIRDHICNSS